MKGSIALGWLLGFMASLPAIQEARGKADEHYCFCIIVKRSLSTQLFLVVLIIVELGLCAVYYWLLQVNKKSKAQFTIQTVTHSLDVRYSLVETIKTTEALLPTGRHIHRHGHGGVGRGLPLPLPPTDFHMGLSHS